MSCCFVLAHLALPCTSVRGSTHDLSPLELLNRKLHTIEDKPSAWSSKCGKSVDSLKLPCMSSGFIWFIQIPTTYMIIILSMYSFAFNPKKNHTTSTGWSGANMRHPGPWPVCTTGATPPGYDGQSVVHPACLQHALCLGEKPLEIRSQDMNIWLFPKMVVPNNHGFSY